MWNATAVKPIVYIVMSKTLKRGTINAERNCDTTNETHLKDCSLGGKQNEHQRFV